MNDEDINKRRESNDDHLRDARRAVIQAYYEGSNQPSGNKLGFSAKNPDDMQDALQDLLGQIEILIVGSPYDMTQYERAELAKIKG